MSSRLSCYLAIANAFLQLIRGEYRFFPTLSILMPVMVNLFAILVWILAIRFADRWNVSTTFARVLAMLVYYPLSAMAVAQVIMCSLMLVSGLEAFSAGFSAGVRQYVSPPISITACGIILFSSVMIYALRRSWHAMLSRI
ncbi:hypothetical protein [Rhodopirellula baltica]